MSNLSIDGVIISSTVASKIPYLRNMKGNMELNFPSHDVRAVINWIENDFNYRDMHLSQEIVRLIYMLHLENEFATCIRKAMISYTISLKHLLLVKPLISLPNGVKPENYYAEYARVKNIDTETFPLYRVEEKKIVRQNMMIFDMD